MSDIFMLLVLLSIAGLLIGLLRPQWLRMPSRKISALVFGGATILFFTGFGITSPTVPAQPAHVATTASSTAKVSKTPEQPAIAPNTPQQPQTKLAMSPADAQKRIDEIMGLGIKAGFVKSYELGKNSAEIVYADREWYTQTVSFKHDFVAEIGQLKEIATGYHHFEVRDAYSNEKLAEYTAFLGSVDVYR